MILMVLALIANVIPSHAFPPVPSCGPPQVPPKAVLMDAATAKAIHADYSGKTYDLLLAGPQKYIVPEKYQTQATLFYNFCPRPDDVYLATYPKADLAWMIEVLWLVMNKMDVTTAGAKRIEDRFSFLEDSMVYNRDVKTLPFDSVPSPRLFKTQLPFSLIPKIRDTASKIVFFARNPKDVMIDSFDYARVTKAWGFTGTIDRYAYYFQNDLTMYAPYWLHLKEGLSQSGNKRVLIVFAEEDPLVLFQKVSTFLGKPFTPAQLQAGVTYMKNKEIPKLRWKTVFSPKLNGEVNAWIRKNITNIKFPNIDVFS